MIEPALVLTLTVNAEAAASLTVTELRESEHVDLASASSQLSPTVPLNPLTGEICRL
jgi:hypothetical protein